MSAPTFSLFVTEQPAKLHRFRYEKEIQGSRMGSLLHSSSSPKTPVKVRVTRRGDLDAGDSRLLLVGCTVFEDLATHPFYLLGSDCSAGVFQKEIAFPAGSDQCDVALERIGIICTPKKSGRKAKDSAADATLEITQSYQTRLEHWNLFDKAARLKPFEGKDVNQLRLAFQLFSLATPDSTQWIAADCKPVATDVISDAKIFSRLVVDCVIPKSVSRRDQDVWLYMKDPLPAEESKRFRVTVQDWELAVKSVRKHLVVFDFQGQELVERGSLDVSVVDMVTGDISNSVELQCDFPDDGSDAPASKKRRQDANTKSEDDLLAVVLQECDEMQYFV